MEYKLNYLIYLTQPKVIFVLKTAKWVLYLKTKWTYLFNEFKYKVNGNENSLGTVFRLTVISLIKIPFPLDSLSFKKQSSVMLTGAD